MGEQQHSTIELTKEEFLRLTTTDSSCLPFTLQDNLPDRCCNRVSQFSLPSKNNLGSLSVFSPEVLQAIIFQLVIHTFTAFQCVNQQARVFITSHPHFQAIQNHALDALRGALHTGIARWITFDQLYKTLCIAECQVCGVFGGLVYLFTCKRVCFRCISEEISFRPLTLYDAATRYGLDKVALSKLRTMWSVSGKYAISEEDLRGRVPFIDRHCARRAGIASHGSAAAMKEHVSNVSKTNARKIHEQRRVKSWLTKSIRYSRSMDRKDEDPLRFMAIVPIPWLSIASGDIAPGRYCRACLNTPWVIESISEKIFSFTSFQEHMKRFGAIENGRHIHDDWKIDENDEDIATGDEKEFKIPGADSTDGDYFSDD